MQIIICYMDSFCLTVVCHVIKHQRCGWEPNAILNWLALAGWGVQHDVQPVSSASSAERHAPDSTAVMSLDEMVQAVIHHLLPIDVEPDASLLVYSSICPT